jgi:hypothetical protein
MVSKLLIACLRNDELACFVLNKAVEAIERDRSIDYGKWKSEGGCRLKRIEPCEMNRHPVLLIGEERDMDLASFEARDQCTRGEGIIVVTHGTKSIPPGLNFIPPYRFFKGLRLVGGENIAGLRKVVLLDPAEGRGEGYRTVLAKHAATAIRISMETEAAAAALFPEPEPARERQPIVLASPINA